MFKLTRKNYLFVGNERAGQAASLHFSMVSSAKANGVNLRLKQYQSLAIQTVPVGKREPDLALLVLFDLCFFGRRPGWRFGTV